MNRPSTHTSLLLCAALLVLLFRTLPANANAQACDRAPAVMQGDGSAPFFSPDGSVFVAETSQGNAVLIRSTDLKQLARLGGSTSIWQFDGARRVYSLHIEHRGYDSAGREIVQSEYRAYSYEGREIVRSELPGAVSLLSADHYIADAGGNEATPGGARFVTVRRTLDAAMILTLPWSSPKVKAALDAGSGRGVVWSASATGPNLIIFDLSAGRELARARLEGGIRSMSVSVGGKFILIATFDKLAYLYDATLGQRVADYQLVSNGVFTRDGEALLLGGGFGAGIVDLREGRGRKPKTVGEGITDVYELPNGSIAAARHGETRVLERSTLREALRIPNALPSPYDGQMPHSGRYIAFIKTFDTEFAGNTIVNAENGRVVCDFQKDRNRFSLWGVSALTNDYIAADWQDSSGRPHWALYRIEDPGAVQPASATMVREARQRSEELGAEQRAQAQGMFRQAFELFQAGEFDAAVRRFTQGLEIDPANGVAHFYLAETYARQNKATLARTHYQRTIDFAPDSREAAIAETRIAK